jgi:hypothetical protein
VNSLGSQPNSRRDEVNKNMRVHAVKRVGRYAAGAALVLGVAVGSAGIAGAEPTTIQRAERPVICNVVGKVPFVASIAGCTTGSPGKPTIPGWPPTTATKVPVER